LKTLDISGELACETIPAILARQAAERPDALHAIFPHRTLTFGELDRQARLWARAFAAQGLEPGDHVATLMPNCPEWLPVYYGALHFGAVPVVLNARYKRQELAYTLAHSRSKLLVTTTSIEDHVDFVALLRDVLTGIAGQDAAQLQIDATPDLRAVVLCEGDGADGFLGEAAFLDRGKEVSEKNALAGGRDARIDDTSAIIYTSGTTSSPKGCELTHASVQNSWSTFSRIVDLAAGETVWMPMPFFHTGGIGPMTAMLDRGAAFITQAHYEPEPIVELIERHETEHLYPGFPQLSFGVIEHPKFDRERFKHVRSLLNVGPPAMQKKIQDLLPDGAVLLNLFGMTEGSGIVTFTPFDAPFPVRAETSGLPPPHTQVRIIDPETGQPCPDGTPGELQFRGGGAFKSYYADPEATAATILADGWVRTGDRGRIDENGFLVFLGRIKDMLKVGGENVAAAEIEAFIQGLPGVQLVQVIGMADDRMGEVPVAFIEPSGGAVLSEQGIIEACDGQLARWKIPRRVEFVSEWPMSATKVQKFRLAELL